MARRFFPAAAFAALALAGCVTAPRPEYPPVAYAGSSGTLPTGMRILTYQLAGNGLFSLAASYRAGSADDPPGKEGLAALVARLSLQHAGGGAGRLTYSQRLFAAGVRFDALAGRDTTDFLASGPASRLGAALAVEADRLRDPLAGVTDGDFRRERDLYAEELADERLVSQGDAGSQWLLEVALRGAPYARPARGTPESVRDLALEDARRWAVQRFTPAHLVVAVTAPPPGRGGEIVKAFGSLATGEPDGVPAWARSVPPVQVPPFPMVTPDPAGLGEPVVRRAPVSGVQLWLAWVLPGEASVDAARARAAVWLAWALVREAASSRGTREVLRWHSAYGFTLAAARVDVDREEDARTVLSRLRGRSAPGYFTALAVGAAARHALELEEYFGLERPDVAFMARQVRLSGQADPLAAWRSRVSTGLAAGFDEWVERWLDPRRAVAVLVLPEKGREEPSQATPREAQPRWSTSLAIEPRLPPGSYDVLGLVEPPGLDAAVRRRLPNGLQVVVLPRPGFPRVEGRLVVLTRPAGSTEVPDGLPQVALLAARPPFSFVDPPFCSFAPAAFQGDHVLATSTGTSTRIPDLLQSLACWTRIRADGSWVKVGQRHLERAWKPLRGTPELAVDRAAWERLFPGWHGTWGDLAAIDAITTGAAGDWLATELRPDRATLIVAGDVAAGPGLFAAIEDAFGGWRARGGAAAPEAAPAEPAPAGHLDSKAVLLGHRPAAKTALIEVWLRTPPLGQRDLAAEEAWIEEVKRVLRRDRGEGGLKSVRASQFDRASGHSALHLATTVKVEDAVWTLRRLLEALGGTAVTPATEGVTGVWRWSLAVDFPFRFATAGDAADRLAELTIRGAPADFWERYRLSVAALDGARIQAVARSFSVGGEVVAIVGDREILEPQLRSAGFQVQVLETTPAPATK